MRMLLLSLMFILCFASSGYAEQTWSPERLFVSFDRAKHEALSSGNGGKITVRGPIANLAWSESGNPILVIGDEEGYTVWCYLADDQGLSHKIGQVITIQGGSARKIPTHEAVQLYGCRIK